MLKTAVQLKANYSSLYLGVLADLYPKLLLVQPIAMLFWCVSLSTTGAFLST